MRNLKPFIIIVSFLFTILLIVPTLLVIPFSNEKKMAESPPKKTHEKTPHVIEPTTPNLNIAVYRSQLEIVENVPIEEYIVGVVASEMYSTFKLEALKAQALAARTFIFKQMLSKEKLSVPDNAIVTDTEMHQVYKSKKELKNLWGKQYNDKIKKITKAVKETEGQILVYKEQPIDASYFSTSNGYTENSEEYWNNQLPYLRSVKSPWDKNSPKFIEQKTFSIADFEKKLGVDIGENTSVGTNISKTTGNRVDTIEIQGKKIDGKKIRELLDLNSTDFEFKRTGDQVIVTTKGLGHGVGMSQFGANGMAQEGKSYKDIISYYYTGVQIANAEQYETKITAKK